jgi:hypothetical protein
MLQPTVSRPVCLGIKYPSGGLRPDVYYCQTVAGLLIWGALSDERTGLSFTTAARPRQRSHFRVRVPLDSRPYFTVSDLRLPFMSPSTTCRATVEVFNPASIRDYLRLHLSLKTVFRELNRKHLIEWLSLSDITKTTPPLCRKHLSTLPSRYNVSVA